jgi:hypothetical protein
VFDAEAPAPVAVKQREPDPRVPDQGWIAIGASAFGPAGARGRAQAEGHSATWELEMAGGAAPLSHLPRSWMYRAPLPRTKLESPLPDAVFSGRVEIDGRRLEVAGWRGMAGHNWGAEHAEHWIWLHGVAFDEAPGIWLDVALGRVRVGGALLPWIANGALALDGTRLALGGPGRVRATHVRAHAGGCQVTLPGRGVRVHVSVRAPREQTVAWVYADPGGGEHHVANCSIAELRVRVERRGRPPLELASDHGGAYELGGPDPVPGIREQPFPDP